MFTWLIYSCENETFGVWVVVLYNSFDDGHDIANGVRIQIVINIRLTGKRIK